MKILRICLLFIVASALNSYGQQIIVADSLSIEANEIILSGDATAINANVICNCCYPDAQNICHGDNNHIYLGGADLFTAYIVSGREHAQLSFGGVSGDSLASITVSRINNTTFYLTTSGQESDNIDTIVVRISTNHPPALTRDVSIFVLPVPQLKVSLEPNILAVGDTANIVIKRQLVNGTLVNFPNEQIFELKTIQGCERGKIISLDKTGQYNYLDSCKGPFQLIVIDNGNMGSISIRVGIDDLITNTEWLEEKFGINTKEAKKLYTRHNDSLKRVKNKDKRSYADNECDSTDEHSGFTAEATSQEKCGNYDEYNPANYVLDYEVVKQPKSFVVASWNSQASSMQLTFGSPCDASPGKRGEIRLGITEPQSYSPYKPTAAGSYEYSWTLKPLYEVANNKDELLHFLIVNPVDTNTAEKLRFDVIWDFCSANVAEIGKKWEVTPVVINSLDELKNIPENMLVQADSDLAGHTTYPLGIAIYVFKEILMTHEEEHYKDDKDSINKYFPNLIADIKSYTALCKTFDENAKSIVRDKITMLITDFIDRINKTSEKVLANDKTRLILEKEVNSRPSVMAINKTYKDAIEYLINSNNIKKKAKK
jgi:hypothetical protein